VYICWYSLLIVKIMPGMNIREVFFFNSTFRCSG